MLQVFQSAPNQPLVYGEFEKATKVLTVPGRGRGLFADEEISAGELILASRALAIVYNDDNSQLSSPLLTRVKRFRQLKEAVAESVKQSLDSALKVYQLHAGPKKNHLLDQEIEQKFSETPIDAARIEGVCLANALSSNESPNRSADKNGGSFGLWVRVSYINHDCCDANATWMIVNDFIFVRAAKDILRGSEILISYIDPHQMYFAKRELFLKHDFICKCKLCQIDANEDHKFLRDRENILCKIIAQCENGIANNPELVLLALEELDSLNSKSINSEGERSLSEVYKLKPLIFLGLAYYESQNFIEAFRAFSEAFEVSRRFVQLNPAKLFLAVAMSRTALRSGHQEELRKWIGACKRLVILQYGKEDNYEIFCHLYTDFVKEMESSGVSVRNIYESHEVVM